MIKTAIITISDKGSKGEREDGTGSALKILLENEGYSIDYYKIIPDEIDIISDELIKLSDSEKVKLIITNGGTGFSKRDVTPEATMKVIEKYVPGIGEAMRAKSLLITPKAVLSRGISGIRKNTLIINLPGSPKGATENLEAVLSAIPHGIEILLGQASECAK
jgi:molybdenum cofactor synthesis domain-containing protein